MAFNFNQLISIILFISILNCLYSQNIITSWHYDKVQMYELETIGDIFTDDNFKDVTFDDFTEDSIDIKNLKISSVHHSLYDSYLNFKLGLLLFSPNKISFSFTFEYDYDGINANATFDLKISMIKMRLKNNKEEQTQTVNISCEYSDSDFSVYDISDKIIAEKVQLALYKGFQRLNFVQGNILSKVNLIEQYKNRLSKKSDFILKTSTLLDNKKISIKLNRFLGFCEDIRGKKENALCYYSGELENEEDKEDRSKVPLNNQDFMNSTEYNVFININLLNKIIKKITQAGIKEKIYDKNVPKKSLSYDFKISSLKKYFNGLDTFDDNTDFFTEIKIIEFDTKTAKFNVAFNIGDQSNVFAIDITMNFALEFSLKKNVRLNLCITSISGIKANISSGTITIKDETGLINAINESFDFKNYPLCLSDDGVSFKDYYAKISKATAFDEGYYLSGKQLYQ